MDFINSGWFQQILYAAAIPIGTLVAYAGSKIGKYLFIIIAFIAAQILTYGIIAVYAQTSSTSAMGLSMIIALVVAVLAWKFIWVFLACAGVLLGLNFWNIIKAFVVLDGTVASLIAPLISAFVGVVLILIIGKRAQEAVSAAVGACLFMDGLGFYVAPQLTILYVFLSTEVVCTGAACIGVLVGSAAMAVTGTVFQLWWPTRTCCRPNWPCCDPRPPIPEERSFGCGCCTKKKNDVIVYPQEMMPLNPIKPRLFPEDRVLV